MLRVLPIRYSDILAHPELIAEYAAECSISAIGRPDPQPAMYEQMECCGLMKCFGLYREALLIGFATLLVSVLPHYGRKVAVVESLFVAAAYRKSLAGGKLMKAIETYAAGCVAIMCSAPVGGDFEAFLEGREEYVKTNSVFCRRIA